MTKAEHLRELLKTIKFSDFKDMSNEEIKDICDAMQDAEMELSYKVIGWCDNQTHYIKEFKVVDYIVEGHSKSAFNTHADSFNGFHIGEFARDGMIIENPYNGKYLSEITVCRNEYCPKRDRLPYDAKIQGNTESKVENGLVTFTNWAIEYIDGELVPSKMVITYKVSTIPMLEAKGEDYIVDTRFREKL